MMSIYKAVLQGARLILLATASSLVSLAGVESGLAQAWPTRAITAIVPFGAGSASDVMPRVTLDQVSTQVGRPIVVENRPGAGGEYWRQRGRQGRAGRLHDAGIRGLGDRTWALSEAALQYAAGFCARGFPRAATPGAG